MPIAPVDLVTSPAFQAAYYARTDPDVPPQLRFDVSLALDSKPLDLSKLVIRYTDALVIRDFRIRGDRMFDLQSVVDHDGERQILSAGEVVEVRFDAPTKFQANHHIQLNLLIDGHHVEANYWMPPHQSGAIIKLLDHNPTTPAAPAAASESPQPPTKDVSAAFKVIGVYGDTVANSGEIDTLRIHLELAAGAKPVDMTQVIIRYSDGTAAEIFDADGNNDGAWTATWIRGAGTNDVMAPGDLVELEFAPTAAIKPRTQVQILIVPESGAPVPADFTTPPTYGNDAVITLR